MKEPDRMRDLRDALTKEFEQQMPQKRGPQPAEKAEMYADYANRITLAQVDFATERFIEKWKMNSSVPKNLEKSLNVFREYLAFTLPTL